MPSDKETKLNLDYPQNLILAVVQNSDLKQADTCIVMF